MALLMTTDRFISQSNIKHGGLYSYVDAVLINCNTKVTITCMLHGSFEQTPTAHMRGSGCQKCAEASRRAACYLSMKKQTKTITQFITQANIIHGSKYVYDKAVYINTRTKVIITCPTHGDFTQSPSKHINAAKPTGCPSCGGRPKVTTESFVVHANSIHNFKYDYTKVHYTNDGTKIEVICKDHGSFYQTPTNHKKKHRPQGCPKCAHAASAKRGIGGYSEVTINPDDVGSLYLVSITLPMECYYKVGITKQSIKQRLRGHGGLLNIIHNVEGSLLSLYRIEQQILHSMADCRYKCPPKSSSSRRNGWTECFRSQDSERLITVFQDITQTIPTLTCADSVCDRSV